MIAMMKVLLLSTLFLAILATIVEALPPGFVDEGFAYVPSPTGFVFVPKQDGDGYMMIVSSKRGLVHLLPDPDSSDEEFPILDISYKVCRSGERGIMGVAVSPDFLIDRYIYIFYPWPKNGNCGESDVDGPVARLSRFVMAEDFMSVDEDSETVLMETTPLSDDIYNGGAMDFGKDGYLYVSIGDGGDRRSHVSQKRDYLLGSMVRVDKDGGIPPDNPFVAQPGSNFTSARCNIDGTLPSDAPPGSFCEEIFAYGIRNPFKFAMDPNTPDGVVRMFFNDVGGGKWEETNELVKGANYGWPIQEGPCKMDSNTECQQERHLMDPVHWYGHTEEGGAAVGCTFVPKGLWPSDYDDAFLYADFVAGEIYKLDEDPSLYCRTCIPPTSGWKKSVFHRWDWPVMMDFGPYKTGQAFYYSVRGSGYLNMRRIVYVGGENMSPVASLTSDQLRGQAGTILMFDGSASSDPNFDPLTFDWDFGDGTAPIVNGPSTVSHQFASQGEYIVTLTVTDDSGFFDEAYVQVIIGSIPTVTITSPPEGAEFAVGDVFTLTGSAVDGSGNPMPEEALSWEVRQHHNTHYHPFLDATVGNNVVLHPAPPPEDFQASTNSYLEIILTATDENGVHGSLSRIVMPKKVVLEFDTSPSRLKLILDDFTVRTPIDVVSWENHNLTVEAFDQSPWFFERWSNNREQKHSITVPAKPTNTSTETSVSTTGFQGNAVNYRFVATYQMGYPPTTAPSPMQTPDPTPGPTSQPTGTIAEPTKDDLGSGTLPPATKENSGSTSLTLVSWAHAIAATTTTCLILGCLM